MVESIDETSHILGEHEAKIHTLELEVVQLRKLCNRPRIPFILIGLLSILFAGIFGWLTVITKVLLYVKGG